MVVCSMTAGLAESLTAADLTAPLSSAPPLLSSVPPPLLPNPSPDPNINPNPNPTAPSPPPLSSTPQPSLSLSDPDPSPATHPLCLPSREEADANVAAAQAAVSAVQACLKRAEEYDMSNRHVVAELALALAASGSAARAAAGPARLAAARVAADAAAAKGEWLQRQAERQALYHAHCSRMRCHGINQTGDCQGERCSVTAAMRSDNLRDKSEPLRTGHLFCSYHSAQHHQSLQCPCRICLHGDRWKALPHDVRRILYEDRGALGVPCIALSE